MKCKRIQIWLLFCAVFLISGMASTASAQGNTVTIDEYNRVILNGVPFFPLGLYVGQCSIYDQYVQLDEIQDSPFDTLMNYTVNTCGDPGNYEYATVGQIESYLDQLESSTLKLIYALNEYIPYDQENEQCDDIDIANIQAKVGNPRIRDHDAVISWYLNDEVGSHDAAAQANCLAQLEAGYDKITDLDATHTVWSVHWNTDWLIQEAHTTDIVGVDPHTNHPNPITLTADMADAAIAAGKPLWLAPQIANATLAEMRAMTYVAVNHGAKGLIYYSFMNLWDDNTDYFTDDGLITWNNIKAIASEIDQLRSVFLSTYQTSGNQISCDNADIDFKLMWEGNTYYLFAVNTKEETITGVSFRINLANKPAAFDTLFEDAPRQIPVSSGTVADDFGPYEVHVYQWEGGFEEPVTNTGGGGGGGGGGGCFITTSHNVQRSTVNGQQ